LPQLPFPKRSGNPLWCFLSDSFCLLYGVLFRSFSPGARPLLFLGLPPPSFFFFSKSRLPVSFLLIPQPQFAAFFPDVPFSRGLPCPAFCPPRFFQLVHFFPFSFRGSQRRVFVSPSTLDRYFFTLRRFSRSWVPFRTGAVTFMESLLFSLCRIFFRFWALFRTFFWPRK